VAFLNMSDPTHVCPSNWSVPNITTDIRTCGRGEFNSSIRCNSVYFPSHGIEYSKVCGRIIGYQLGTPEAFAPLLSRQLTIEKNYVDGVSLTHGEEGSREHIWTFAGAKGEDSDLDTKYICDCSNGKDWPHSTSFVGNDYFCDAGSNSGANGVFYSEDPLWDGEGCGTNSTCCEFNNPPWFCKSLPQPTTDDLEARICYFNKMSTNEDTPIELIELYVQ